MLRLDIRSEGRCDEVATGRGRDREPVGRARVHDGAHRGWRWEVPNMKSGKPKGLAKMLAHVGPNMTPMVDIAMCILIFFMLGSSFVPGLYLTSNTPVVRQGPCAESPPDVLPPVQDKLELRKIAGQTKVFAFGAMIEDLDKALPEFLTQKHGELSKDVQLIIVPDKAVRYQDVLTVYEGCIKARFENVAFGFPR